MLTVYSGFLREAMARRMSHRTTIARPTTKRQRRTMAPTRAARSTLLTPQPPLPSARSSSSLGFRVEQPFQCLSLGRENVREHAPVSRDRDSESPRVEEFRSHYHRDLDGRQRYARERLADQKAVGGPERPE